MYIKYKPARKRAQDSKVPAPTNIGEFLPGQVGGPYATPSTLREAMQLVRNGEFVQTDPSGVELTGDEAEAQLEPSAPAPKAAKKTSSKKTASKKTAKK